MVKFKKYGVGFSCSDELFYLYSQHSKKVSSVYSDLVFMYYLCSTNQHPNKKDLDWLKSEGLQFEGRFNEEMYLNSSDFQHASFGYGLTKKLSYYKEQTR